MRAWGLTIRYLGTMRIGSLTLPSKLFLSPLAGYTNLPFRLVVREIGGVGLVHHRPRQRPLAAGKT
jgi:tRNA-dihydrouridine synthase